MNQPHNSLQTRVWYFLMLVVLSVTGTLFGLSVYQSNLILDKNNRDDLHAILNLLKRNLDKEVQVYFSGQNLVIGTTSSPQVEDTIKDFFHSLPEIESIYLVRTNEGNGGNFISMERAEMALTYSQDSTEMINQIDFFRKIADLTDLYIDHNPERSELGIFRRGYAPFFSADGSLNGILVVTLNVTDLDDQKKHNAFNALGTASGVLLFFGILNSWIAKKIVFPVTTITKRLEELSQSGGDLSWEGPTSGEMNSLFESIKRYVAKEKKTNLENLQIQSFHNSELSARLRYLESASLISRAVINSLDFKRSVHQLIELIRAEFNFYFIGLYVLDPEQVHLILRAGTGKSGQSLIERHHSIQVGEGLVGGTLVTGESRVSMEVGKNAAGLATPELPLTRSEAALPLIARGRKMGALSLHSEQVGKFDKNLLTVMQMLADVIAISLDNARKFNELELELHALQESARKVSGIVWNDFLKKRNIIGYTSNERGISPISHKDNASFRQNASTSSAEPGTLSLPLEIRGMSLGTLYVNKALDKYNRSSHWTEQERTLLFELAEQLVLALDNALLLNTILSNAEREKILSEIAADIRSSTSVKKIMQTSLKGLAEALHVPRGSIQLNDHKWVGDSEIEDEN